MSREPKKARQRLPIFQGIFPFNWHYIPAEIIAGVALAGALAIIAAIFLILARLIWLGFLANFLAKSVLIGFLTGVGIQVALGQVGGMLGVQTHGNGTIQKFVSALQQIPQANIPTVIISLLVLLIIISASKINNKIPGALIAVVGMIIASN